MTDIKYMITNDDGHIMEIYPIKEINKMLEQKFSDLAKRVDYFQEKYQKLKDEKWKDNELQKMKEELIKTKKDAMRGFPISEDESKAISDWIDKHEKEKHPRPEGLFPRGGAIGGSYSYIFTPTSVGVFGTIKCTCGEKFDFQEEA